MKEPRNTPNKRTEPYSRKNKKVEQQHHHSSSSDDEYHEEDEVQLRSASPESKLHSVANLSAAAAASSSTPTDVSSSSEHRSSPSSSSTDDDKRSKKKLELNKEDLEKYFHMSQQHAAAKLGVSVSTLKRRFYEIFNNKRWPYHHAVHGPSSKQAKEARNRQQQQGQLPAIAPQRPSALLQQPAIVNSTSTSTAASSTPSPVPIAPSPVATKGTGSANHHQSHPHSHAAPSNAPTPAFVAPLIKPKSITSNMSASSMKEMKHVHTIQASRPAIAPSPIFPTYTPASPRQMTPSSLAAPSPHTPIRFFGTHEHHVAPAGMHDNLDDCVEERILAEYEIALARPVPVYPPNSSASSSSSSSAPPSAFQKRDGFSRPHPMEDIKPAIIPQPAFARLSSNSVLVAPPSLPQTPPTTVSAAHSAPARNEAKFSLAYIMLEQNKDEKVIDKVALSEVFNWDERPAFVDALPKDRYARYENFSVFPKSQQ